MDNLPISDSYQEEKIRNPKTKAQYRRDFRVQILIPILLFFIGMITMVTWIISNKIGSPMIWANIVVILTILPILILGIILFSVLLGLIYLSAVLNKEIPPVAYKAQRAIFKIKSQVERGADISVLPIIQIKSFLATIDTVFNLFRGNHE